MAFQIRNFVSIAAGMANYVRSVTQKITDFNIGSAIRTLLEAVAAELDELYQQMFNGLKEAIPVATYNTFGFTRLPAIASSGLIRVTIGIQAANVFIPAGTVFRVNGNSITWISISDVTITAGQTFGDVLAAADTAGAASNLAQNTSFTMTPVPTGFVSAINSAGAFLNGADLETDAARQIRFAAFIAALARGTLAAITYGTKNFAYLTNAQGLITERVASISIYEPWIADNTQPPALINIFIHNGVGSTSSPLITKAHDVIFGYYDTFGVPVPGWKAAGVKVTVAAATETALNLTGVLTAASGYSHSTLVTSATAALNAYLLGLDIGVSAIKSKMIELVMDIPGVYNFTMSAPAGDTTADYQHKIMPGTIAIT